MSPWPRKIWENLRASFWFLPSLMCAAALALALAAVALDKAVPSAWLESHPWAYTGGAEGASQVLGTIAGSMVTIAGVVFSMTLIALSLASSQLGPRLLRSFMRDTTNQMVLGTFLATFVYCLLVLRTIRRVDEIAFVPHIAVSMGVLFALVSVGVLIHFIHHVSVSIQADVVIARVGTDLLEAIERLYPDDADATQRAASGPGLPESFDRSGATVRATKDGYLQIVDVEALLALATREDLVLRLERRQGQYVAEAHALLSAWPGERLTDALAESLRAAFIIGQQRTAAQDIEFAVNQLVEIALRALSQGINDPFTAIACVDRLGSGLARLSRRSMPSPFHRDAHDRVRLVAPGPTFPGVLDAALNPIRQAARSNTAVTLRLLETVASVAEATRQPEDRAALRRHAEMLARGAREGLPESEDRRAAEDRYQAATAALG